MPHTTIHYRVPFDRNAQLPAERVEISESLGIIGERLDKHDRTTSLETVRLEYCGSRPVKKLISAQMRLILGDTENTTELEEALGLATSLGSSREPFRYGFGERFTGLCFDSHRNQPARPSQEHPEVRLGSVASAIQMHMMFGKRDQNLTAFKLRRTVENMRNYFR
jgi:hypothetical protein